MSKDFENSKTKECLKRAFAGEAMAHLKYQFYKSKLANYSKKYETVFDEIIHNEKEHGEIWFKHLHDNVIDDNVVNLLDAIKGETFEHLEMYPVYSQIAKEEGCDEISKLFEDIAEIEGRHSQEFSKILDEVKSDYYDEEATWKCLNCGHIVKGKAPDECPVCKHPKKYFVQI